MNNPLVSVIMPAYNAEKYIDEAIDSVISQTFANWELIIVNDGSTDDTQKIVEAYVSSDTRIKLINQENKRLGAARNEGIKNANGEWVAFLDADDLWINTKLEKQLAAAAEQPDAGVIFTGGFTFYDDDLKTAKPRNGAMSPMTKPKIKLSFFNILNIT